MCTDGNNLRYGKVFGTSYLKILGGPTSKDLNYCAGGASIPAKVKRVVYNQGN